MANSTVTKVCNRLNKNGSNGEETNGIHGIALGICVEKDVDKSKFTMHAQMQTSYSDKRSAVWITITFFIWPFCKLSINIGTGQRKF
jgi:predicted transcriptional regulator YdeE